jgi:trimeric autotransporter adhesin
MKHLILILVLTITGCYYTTAQVGIGTTNPDGSSLLEVKAIDKGILIPRMSAIQRDALPSPVRGLMVYVNDDNTFYFYSGTAWTKVLSAISPDGDWTLSGTNMYSAVSGNVGIGVTAPAQQLEISASMRVPATTSATTGVIYKGTTPFLHDYKAPTAFGYNTFVGLGSGNFTMGTGVGYQASSNTGVGNSTLSALTSGYENTGLGNFALTSNTTGYENTAVGQQAMISNLGGQQNTGIGVYALYNNTSGSFNTAVGLAANYYNQAGSNNTMIGNEAGRGTALHSKSGNVFIGYQAGYFETGNQKLYIENSGSATPLIGGDFSMDEVYINGKMGIGTSTPSVSALLDLTSTTRGLILPRMTTAQRTAISGVDGLMVYDTDIDDIFIFRNGAWGQSLSSASGWTVKGNTGTVAATNFLGTIDDVPLKIRINNTNAGLIDKNGNTGLGYTVLSGLSTGTGNVAIGNAAMDLVTTGSNNTCVGAGADVSANNLTNATALGNGAIANASNKVVLGNSSATTVGGYGLWTNYSDRRLKENIVYRNSPGIDFILKLRPVSYNYIKDENKTRRDGLIAQDVQQALNELGIQFSGLVIDNDSMKTMNLSYESFVIPLITAVKEQQAIIEKLQKRVEALEKR